MKRKGSQGVCYAFYGGEISRNRFLFMIALPRVILTMAPIAAFYITGKINMWLAAIIRNNGWDTYWRPNA